MFFMRFMRDYSFTFLLTLMVSTVLVGCTTEQMRVIGESRCLDLPASQLGDRRDCVSRNKRTFDEFEQFKKQEATAAENAMRGDDSLCYKNPKADEKPCAAIQPMGK